MHSPLAGNEFNDYDCHEGISRVIPALAMKRANYSPITRNDFAKEIQTIRIPGITARKKKKMERKKKERNGEWRSVYI